MGQIKEWIKELKPCLAVSLSLEDTLTNRLKKMNIQPLIRINNDNGDSDSTTMFIDSTVQPKNITYPTDAKLYRKIIKRCLKIVKTESPPLRKSYRGTLNKLGLSQHFRNHPTNKGKARKADKKPYHMTKIMIAALCSPRDPKGAFISLRQPTRAPTGSR